MVSDFLRDRFGLREEIEILAASGLRVGSRHVEPAERMHAHERARALAVQVEVAAEELPLTALEPLPVARIEGARQAVLRIVGDGDTLIEILDGQDREHRPENLLFRELAGP